MKKNKSTEKSVAPFGNSPFKALKNFKSESSQAPARKKAVPKQIEKNEDDAELFLRAVSGVKTISPGEMEHLESGKPSPAQPREKESRDDDQLFLNAMLKMGTAFKENIKDHEDDQAGPQSASSRMKQLKRGTISIHEELDLHGYLKEEALAKLARFIAGACQRGQKAVLVITGKGINSPEGPVLQGAVAAWLREKGKGMVAEFAPAPRDRGGSGAFVVFLKSR